MELHHEFEVPVPVADAWRALLDIERVAPCIPGATLLSVDGDDFTGAVKVKVGPITVSYNGDASFQDEQPLVDVNERFDPRLLKVTFPRKVDVSFVMSHGRDAHVVHIYLGSGEHQSMTASVARCCTHRSGDERLSTM